HTTRFHREPVSLTLAILLGMGIAAGMGTGTTALVHGTQQMTQLETAMDPNLKILETSITTLQESLTSLSEVVLQNRRGLDLLFLREESLCAAIRGKCCFYANHTGVVKKSMSKLKKNALKSVKEREKPKKGDMSLGSHSPPG
ncbi:hypothetical protein H1C71_001867, partial [Ictidomys tridecemlineatus]